MVKTYLRYVPSHSFGVVCSPDSQIIYDWSGRFAIAGCLEKIVIWNIRQASPYCTLEDPENSSAVTVIAISPDKLHIAAGYTDGKIRVWRWNGGRDVPEPTVLAGHKASITSLAYDSAGSKESTQQSVGQYLSSGAADGRIVVWDMIQQQGLFRLQGHKNHITQIEFVHVHVHETELESDEIDAESSTPARKVLSQKKCLISSSKDGFLKVWDLATQHCVQTVSGHRGEIWSFCTNSTATRLYTGTSDAQIRMWTLIHPGRAPEKWEEEEETYNKEQCDISHSYHLPYVLFLGSFARECKERVNLIQVSPSGGMLAVQANDRRLELFSIFDEKEAQRRRKRRIKRVAKKRAKKEEEKKAQSNAVAFGSAMLLDGDTEAIPDFAASDEVAALYTVRAESKIRCCNFCPTKPQILVSLATNSLYCYDLTPESFTESSSVSFPGHPSDIRSLSLSSDNYLLMSTSNKFTKLWNVRTGNCIRSISSGYGLCSAFVPGDRHIVVGTKEGILELHSVASGDTLATYPAHTAEIWSLCVRPDLQGIVTASADHYIKFWDFELQQLPHSKGRNLVLVETKSVKMEDDVLCVTISKDQRFLACSLLDNTIKVFYLDSMKFFLSLYGHSLPVLSMDISSDGAILASASADKNVKIWGLDFGDCHRSIFAHDDSVMQVKFVPQTHYFFTSGKDGCVKYWDGDTFEMIMVLRGHHSEIWALTLSSDAEFIVSASNDRSIRVWDRTQEQLFIEEEREIEMERMFESTLEEEQADAAAMADEGQESAFAGTRNLETIKAGERILEALDIAMEEVNRYEEFLQKKDKNSSTKSISGFNKSDPASQWMIPPTSQEPSDQKFESNKLLMNKSPALFLLDIVRGVNANDLEQALMLISFVNVVSFLRIIEQWLERGWSVELSCRCLFHLLRLHHNQLSANASLLPTLSNLKRLARASLKKQKDMIGFNLAAMMLMKRSIEESTQEKLFAKELMPQKRQKKGIMQN